MKRLLVLLALLSLPALVVADVIDRVAAVVNDDIILLSEVDERIFLLAAQGQIDAADTNRVDEIRKDVLERLVEEKLVVQRAESQGITVDESELVPEVDAAVEQVRKRYGSEQAFQNALEAEGITLSMLRERYESDLTNERLAQRIVGREVRSSVNVTTEDVETYYNENQGELPGKSAEVRLAHLVVEPRNDEVEAAAQREVAGVRDRLRAGGDFQAEVDAHRGLATLSRFCPGDLDPQIEDAVAGLEPGGISEPVRSAIGYHVFQLGDREENGCYTLRFVVVEVPTDEVDVSGAQASAEEARQRILDGEQWNTVVAEYSDDAETRDNGGDLGWTPVEALLPEVGDQVGDLAPGEVSTVVRSDRGFHVFRMVERREGGDYTFDEIREQLRRYLESQKLQEAYDEWMVGIRDSAYVEIKTWKR